MSTVQRALVSSARQTAQIVARHAQFRNFLLAEKSDGSSFGRAIGIARHFRATPLRGVPGLVVVRDAWWLRRSVARRSGFGAWRSRLAARKQ